MFVNNGQYRQSTFVIRRFVNGREIFNSPFPVIERINLAFAEVSGITLEALANLTDAEYLNRVSLFYQYLEFKYPFFKVADHPSLAPTGTDLDKCPLNYDISMSVFANLRLELSESGLNKEAIVYLDLETFNGDPASTGVAFNIILLVKEFYGTGLIDWSVVPGSDMTVSFSGADTGKEVIELFRYKGTDDQTKDFKNVFVQILDIEEGVGVEPGGTTVVFTQPTDTFYLANLISNIQDSVQNFPLTEALESLLITGEGAVSEGAQSYLFTFNPNQKARPVFMYPDSYPPLKSIEYANYEGMDVLDSGVFDTVGINPKTVNLNGTIYKVYASKNLIIHPHTLKYSFNF